MTEILFMEFWDHNNVINKFSNILFRLNDGVVLISRLTRKHTMMKNNRVCGVSELSFTPFRLMLLQPTVCEYTV